MIVVKVKNNVKYFYSMSYQHSSDFEALEEQHEKKLIHESGDSHFLH